jgi:hypothetical protein
MLVRIRKAVATSIGTCAARGVVLVVFLLVIIPHGARGQLYSEDFESQNAGETTDDDAVWSLDDSGASLSNGGHFEIKTRDSDLLLEGENLDGPAIWKTDQDPIDISSAARPQFSLVLSETGEMEDNDYVDVAYSTDGGDSFTMIENYDGLGDSNHTLTGDFGTVTVRETGLSGSSLVLRVTMENSAGSEQHRLDDVTVTDPALKFAPTEATVAENDGTTTLTVKLLDETTAPISADVEFQAGTSSASASDIDGFSSETVDFASSAQQGDTKDVTVHVEDDNKQEGLETAEFAITDVSGGEPTGGLFTLEIVDTEVVINEVLADPPGSSEGDLEGDANGDGTRDATDDEFIEIYNNSSSELDLSGFSLGDDGGSSRHTFPKGTLLDPGEAVVVFGGGSPDEAAIPGIVQTATDGLLSLSNSGDTILVSDPSGSPYLTFTYGAEGGENESLTRDPDFTGDFVQHATASPSDAPFSPGETTSGTALPVELVSLNAVSVDGGARLTWRTASETNNARFEVEHNPSGDGSGWTVVGAVQSKASGGTSTDLTSYRYRVEDLAAGTHRFRLRQVDRSGASVVADSVRVNVQMQQALTMSVPSPNPVSSVATLSFAIQERAETIIQLYNALGQRVRTVYRGTPPAEQEQNLRIDTAGLPSGIYFVRLQASGRTRTQRLTVVR